MGCLFVTFADCHQHSWVTLFLRGDATAMARPDLLGGNDRKRERDIGWD